MTSVHTIPITPTPASETKSRQVRQDRRSVSLDQFVDASPETRKLPETLVNSNDTGESSSPDEDMIKDIRPDVRPIIERLDGAKDQVDVIDTEEPDQADIALQANDAYHALRKPDEDLTTVGTI